MDALKWCLGLSLPALFRAATASDAALALPSALVWRRRGCCAMAPTVECGEKRGVVAARRHGGRERGRDDRRELVFRSVHLMTPADDATGSKRASLGFACRPFHFLLLDPHR